MSSVNIEAKGVGATVTFDGVAVTISRKGVAGALRGGRGETRVPVGEIMAVHLKPPTTFVAGFIQFLTSARQVPSSSDQNAIMFNKPVSAAFEALRDAVQAALPEREPGPDVIEAKGLYGATVTFDGTTVAITRKGFNATVVGPGAGEKRIPLRMISAIQFKASGLSWYIQFSFSGESTSSRRQSMSDLRKDENTVEFGPKERQAFEALRDAIEAARAQEHAPAPVAAAGPTVAERIQQLAGLHDQGLISDAEFEAKRAQLLAEL